MRSDYIFITKLFIRFNKYPQSNFFNRCCNPRHIHFSNIKKLILTRHDQYSYDKYDKYADGQSTRIIVRLFCFTFVGVFLVLDFEDAGFAEFTSAVF